MWCTGCVNAREFVDPHGKTMLGEYIFEFIVRQEIIALIIGIIAAMISVPISMPGCFAFITTILLAILIGISARFL